MAEEIPVTQARADFAELVNRVSYGGERIVMTRHGKPLAAIVPPADLERLEQLDHDTEESTGTVVRMPHTQHVSATERRLDIAAQDHTPRGPFR
jgi:prevent-host-death family protein